MICCIGEVGVVSKLMPNDMRAVQSVMAVVMGDDEAAIDKIDSNGL